MAPYFALDVFMRTLQDLPARPGVFNPWRDWDPVNDANPDAPVVRGGALLSYLAMRIDKAKLVLVGEAPGYQGAARSGIAMTSERILLGHLPEVPPGSVFEGLATQTSRPEKYPKGCAEPTATITWKQLLALGFKAEEFVFWNAFPCHPHKPDLPLSNRAPTAADMASAAHVLPALLALFPLARVVAMGKVAQRTLAEMGHEVPAVRHPANGGATEFRAQMGLLMPVSDNLGG